EAQRTEQPAKAATPAPTTPSAAPSAAASAAATPATSAPPSSASGSSAATASAANPASAPTPPSGARTTPLRGVAARIAQNMDASLSVPTATSVRAIPAKLLVDNRIVINNHLARGRGGKVSFTHLIGFAVVRALAKHPEMNNSYAEIDGKPVLVTP